MKNIKILKRVLIALCSFVLVFLIALTAGANFLVEYAIGRTGDGGNRQVELEIEEVVTDENIAHIREVQKEQWSLNEPYFEEHPEQTVQTEAPDGLLLNAGMFEQEDSHLWVIAIHGYRSRHEHMATFSRMWYEHGYNVLSPDLRACGNSEGNYVGMGWPDRKDMLVWIDWIIQNDPEAVIVLHGISMGGATVMMTSGEDTPENVIAFVEDCGYTSVYDIFASELKLRFHLPSFPFMNAAGLLADLKAGYSFTEASSMEAVARCEKPMLFIHGTADTFIPVTMLHKVYAAKTHGEKEILEVPGAGHGEAMYPDFEKYWNTVFAFTDRYTAE